MSLTYILSRMGHWIVLATVKTEAFWIVSLAKNKRERMMDFHVMFKNSTMKYFSWIKIKTF